MTKTRYSDAEIGALRSALARADNAVHEAEAGQRMAHDALATAILVNLRHDFEAAGGVVGETIVEIKGEADWERPFIVVGFSVVWRSAQIACASVVKSGKPHATRRRYRAPEHVRIIKDVSL